MPGTMNGGGTIIGPGRRWSDHQDFPVSEPPIEHVVPASVITQRELLTALGISRKLMRSKSGKGGEVLKQLVADGLLLDTGQPNHAHPRVREIASRKAKA